MVITGIGFVTPCGLGIETAWANHLAGRQHCHALTRFQVPDCEARAVAEIHDFEPRDWMPYREVRRLDRYCQFAVAAGRLALDDAGFTHDIPDPARSGISMGSALGGISQAEAQHEVFVREGPEKVPRLLAIQIFGGTAHAAMAMAFGLQGPATTNSNSCAAGAVAIADGFRFIREGRADVMLAGGSEAPIAPLTYAAFDFINTMSRHPVPEEAFRPFDRDRDGFVMGEGAAVLVLESLSHARQRGARIYAEIAGCSLNNDAFHMTTPRSDGLTLHRLIRDVLNDARTRPEEVGLVNGHASATQVNDRTESDAIRACYHPHRPAVHGTKAVTGHSLGAVGAMETAIVALALHHQVIPPTANLRNPDPDCLVDIVQGDPREVKLTAAATHSFGFGGINSALLLRRFGA